MKTQDYALELARDFDRWNHIVTEGTTDPFWPDGTNLNLVRRHIINAKQAIEKKMKPEDFPEIYYRPTPPEVSDDFMANAEGIRLRATSLLADCEANKNYRYINKMRDFIPPNELEKLGVTSVIWSIDRLKKSVSSGDLVTMRGYMYSEFIFDDLKSCADNIRVLPVSSLRAVQGSLIS